MFLEQPVSKIKGIGPSYAQRLMEQGIKTIRDLLLYAPFRFDDLRLRATTQSYQLGILSYFEGQLSKMTPLSRKSGKAMVKGVFADEKGMLPVIWFHSPYVLQLKSGEPLRLIGKVERFGQVPTLVAPMMMKQEGESPHVGRLVPIYHEFQGITSKWLRTKIWELLAFRDVELQEGLKSVGQKDLMSVGEAFWQLHFPTSLEEYERARWRFAYEELFDELLGQKLLTERMSSQLRPAALRLKQFTAEVFVQSLPFELSISQMGAMEEMLQEMHQEMPMNRMLVGDVGSGKTVVAAALAYAVAKNGFKIIVMAPTQILAQQHYQTFEQFFGPHGIAVQLITSENRSEKIEGDVVIGTHALLHRGWEDYQVGLVVVDEQHRFGVQQRELLKSKVATATHFLSMTATPIPRTLALVMLSHLRVSTLDSRRSAGSTISSRVVPHQKRLTAYHWVNKYLLERGGQAFVVCPFIEKSESLDSVRSAITEYEFLSKQIFPSLRVALLHGAMKSEEKETILGQFQRGEFDVLVTTPVVEVGIDIPEANFIVIESAERFGLAQLHQLRGRVGRRGQEAFCFVIPSTADQDENKRLSYFASTADGFALAEFDLEQRGSGTLFGDLQSGFQNFKFAQLTDKVLVDRVVSDVEAYMQSISPELRASLTIEYQKRLEIRLH